MARTGDDVKGYNAGAMLLHWAVAAGILVQLAIGFVMMRLDVIPDALRFAVFQWHKSIGLLVLTLTVARIAWRLFNPPPAHAPMSGVESAAASTVHFLFYVLMLIVPLTGWVMVSASPTAIPTLLMMSPSLLWPNLPLPASWHGEAGAETAATLHTWLAYSTAALLVLHVAGALKHSVLDRAPSFSRMLPVGGLHRQSTSLLAIPVAAGLAAVFLGGGIAIGKGGGPSAGGANAPALEGAAISASGWTIDKAASRITFEVPFSGKAMAGTVGNWDAAVTFDPAALDAASAEITVDPASITVEDAFVGGSVAGPDGFDVAAHPSVTVRLERFERTGDAYAGHGTATIRGKTAPIDVPFAFTPGADGSAHVVGSAVIDRLAFELGASNDGTAQWLGREVTVRLDLKATPPARPPAF